MDDTVEYHPNNNFNIAGLSILSTIFVFSAFVGLLFHAIYFNEPSVYFTFIIFLFFGIIAFRRSGKYPLQFFLISFGLNVLIAGLLTYYFNIVNQIPFTKGGDDFAFYDLSVHWVKGIEPFNKYALKQYGIIWETIDYKLYIIIFGNWFKFLHILNIRGDHFFHLNIINCWFGALVPPLTFLIANKTSSRKIAFLTTFFILIYSPIIYYSTVIIRDTLIIAFFLSLVWVCVKNISRTKKLIFSIFFIYLMFHLRAASALFGLIFLSAYFLSGSRIKQVKLLLNKKVILFLILVIILIASLFVATDMALLKSFDFYIFQNILRYYEYYQEHSLEQASSDSIGSILKQSNNPIVFILYIFIIYLSPLPPEFIKNFNVVNFFIGFGNILWYVVAPTFIIAILQSFKSNSKSGLLRATILGLAISLIFVTMTSGNSRHLYFLHPLIAFFSIDYAVKHKKQFLIFMLMLIIGVFFGIIFYGVLKFI